MLQLDGFPTGDSVQVRAHTHRCGKCSPETPASHLSVCVRRLIDRLADWLDPWWNYRRYRRPWRWRSRSIRYAVGSAVSCLGRSLFFFKVQRLHERTEAGHRVTLHNTACFLYYKYMRIESGGNRWGFYRSLRNNSTVSLSRFTGKPMFPRYIVSSCKQIIKWIHCYIIFIMLMFSQSFLYHHKCDTVTSEHSRTENHPENCSTLTV